MEEYVQFLYELKNIQDSSVVNFEKVSKRVTGSGAQVKDGQLQIFSDPNPVKIEMAGMIQGETLVWYEALSFWCRKDNSSDHKYHLHITSNGYSNHTHKHHIIAKKKKKRKFAVRCVEK